MKFFRFWDTSKLLPYVASEIYSLQTSDDVHVRTRQVTEDEFYDNVKRPMRRIRMDVVMYQPGEYNRDSGFYGSAIRGALSSYLARHVPEDYDYEMSYDIDVYSVEPNIVTYGILMNVYAVHPTNEEKFQNIMLREINETDLESTVVRSGDGVLAWRQGKHIRTNLFYGYQQAPVVTVILDGNIHPFNDKDGVWRNAFLTSVADEMALYDRYMTVDNNHGTLSIVMPFSSYQNVMSDKDHFKNAKRTVDGVVERLMDASKLAFDSVYAQWFEQSPFNS